MDKRYQVFISSTYADLKQERQRVIQALMEMDRIPAGMELFPAADEDQWAFIKRVIDDCDYYLLIIGGRYGSTTPEGISYTEKEFDYAAERGIRIVALLHEDPNLIPFGKSDGDPKLREKLEAFRKKVTTGRLVKFWKSAEELPGLVALSLAKTIKTYPAVGWVRASGADSEKLLVELNDLRKQHAVVAHENAGLRKELKEVQSTVSARLDNIADFDSQFTVEGGFRNIGDHGSHRWMLSRTWRQLFALVAPFLMNHPSDSSVHHQMMELFTAEAGVGGTLQKTLDDQIFKTVSIQFRALGLVDIEYSQTTKGGAALFWSLTPLGEQVMVSERTIKKQKA